MNSFLKYFFVLINLVFVTVGALCIGFVLWIRTIDIVESTLGSFAVDQLFFYFGLILGGLLVLVGLCGALGACYEKKGILVLYLCFILFFVGCELAAIVYTIVRGGNEFENNLKLVWDSIATNETKFIVQTAFNCCGFRNASEWKNDYHISCINISSVNNISSTNNTEVPWDNSCQDEILNWFRANIFVVGGALMAVLLFQIFQAVVTCLLVRSIKIDNRVESNNRAENRNINQNRGNARRPNIPTYGHKNLSHHNSGYLEDDCLYDDDRGRNMKIKRQRTEKTDHSSDW